MEVAVFGGGCFWCIEAVVLQLKGVHKVESGYSGGTVPGEPTYREICSGLTGHAEVIQVWFDPNVISFAVLITIFMTCHDPTQLNRQGADRGTQYRSIIFYQSIEQKAIIETVFSEVQAFYAQPIVTETAEFKAFYKATEEHQDYYRNNVGNGYCSIVIDPKLAKLKAMYSDKLIKNS